MWEDFSGTVGFWADMDDPYVTYHNSFIESEWWALKQIWDKGFFIKDLRSCLTVRVAERRFLHRKLHRDTKM